MGIVRNQSIKSTFSFYFGMMIGAINTVIVYPNVFKETPEHFGLIQILVSYAVVIATITTFGMPKAFVRFFPAIKDKGQLYFLSLIVPLIGFVLAVISYYLFKSQIFELLNASQLLRDNFFYIILLIFFIGFYDVLTAISRAFFSTAIPIFINEVFLKLYILSILILHWLGYIDFSTFLQVYILGYLLKFLILFIIELKNKYFDFSLSVTNLNIKEIINFGLFVLAGGASIIIVARLDMMMIASLLDLEQVAFYAVAFYIGNAIKIPARAITSISTPLIANAWEKQDLRLIQNLYYKTSINQLILGGVFFLCIWLSIDDIFSLLPLKFQGGKWVVFFIGLSQLFNITTGINGVIIINSSYYRYDFITNLILLLFTFIANYIFIPSDWHILGISISGINGAALATALSIFLFNIIRLFVIKIKMDMQPFDTKTIYVVILLILIFLSIKFIPFTEIPILNIGLRSLAVLILFFPMLFIFNLSEDITRLINDIKKNIIS
ncbi:MAG: oligosaccharide flippase family protein [Bacteroidota bacterium]|nr:oligosaccharide flippase family protein [Bacteroidota bacterium]